MVSPHMRRRYRATGARPRLFYLFALFGLAAMYVGLRVYFDRRLTTVDALQRELDGQEALCSRLLAQRDSLLGLPVIGPRAESLGLGVAHIDQMARLPLGIPIPDATFQTPASFELAGTVDRIRQWIDPPSVQPQEALAGE